MDYSTEIDEDNIDLLNYSVLDSCLWLIDKLKIQEYESNPYSLPFLNYITTWHRAVPLNCIVMAQSPYPQNVYPFIAAAMSYNEYLAEVYTRIKVNSIPIPPTVHIFANDMYINAAIPKQDTIQLLKNGWMLINKGILLVNEGVFTRTTDPEYYDESVAQCRVIIRLLQETELYGTRTVDVYGLGEAGQRMASNLCSWYKSSIVRLSKHTTTHPAAISRRFNNFDHPDCHMNTPSFSKSLAKHFSNQVAYIYTMAKKSEADIRAQQQADLTRTAGIKLEELEREQVSFNTIIAEGKTMDLDNKDLFRQFIDRLYTAGNTLAFRQGIASSALLAIQRINSGISSQVSRPGPSLQSPSQLSLNSHIGQEYKPAQQFSIPPTKMKLAKSRVSSTSNTINNDSFTHVSPPPSVLSVQSSTTPTKMKLPKSKSTNSTPTKYIEQSNPDSTSKLSTQLTESSIISSTQSKSDIEPESSKEEPRTKSSLSAHFRKNTLALHSKSSDNSGQLSKKIPKGGPLEITPIERDQLSAIEAVVQVYKADFDDDEECTNVLEMIQNDISAMVKYNSCTVDLITAINKDIEENSKFEFINWAIDNTKFSHTYEKCKEIFNF